MKYDLMSVGELRTVHLCGTNTYFTPEFHPDRVLVEHDLLYIIEGEWTICQNGEAYPLKADDMLLLRSGARHYSLDPCAPNTRTMFIHFSETRQDRYDVELTSQQLAGYIGGEVVCIPTVTGCARMPVLRQHMRRIVEMYWSDREDKGRQMGLYLNFLLGELSYVGRDTQVLNEEWLARILRAMRTNPSKMYSLEELATMADMSVRTLSTHFKRAMGLSVHQYQLNLKLEMAFALIRSEPDRTLMDIAINFGFYDAYHFSRLFKAKFGFPPKHFRRGKE